MKRTNHNKPGKPNFLHRLRKHAAYIHKYPGVMPRAAGNYLRMSLGRRRLRGIELALGFDCFAQCAHCSVLELNRKAPDRPPMSLEQTQDVIRQCLDLGALNINLTGGEPLLNPNLSRIIEACRPKSTVVSLATNGVPLNEKKARDIAGWGISIVTMSIDSADAARHDRSRGIEGCFDRMMRGVDLLQEMGVEVFLNTILTKENHEDGDMMRMVELTHKKGVTLTINPACPVGGWAGNDLVPSQDQRDFHRALMKIPHVRWEGSSNYFKDGCPAGIEKLYISHLGDVMPCNFAHITFGDLREKPLAVIWESMLGTKPFNKIHDRCLVAEDPDFQKKYLEPVYKSPVHPLPVEDHPAFRE